MSLLGWLFGDAPNPIIGPARGTRPGTNAELRALRSHENTLRRMDARDGGNRYRRFRATEDADYANAQRRDPWFHW